MTFGAPGRWFMGRSVNKTATEKFEESVLPHLETVYRVALSLTNDPTDAEDLVQETVVHAVRGFHTFELRHYGAKPWLMRIMHNVFYKSCERRRRAPTLLDDVDLDYFEEELADAVLDNSVESGFHWDNLDQELKSAVNGLRPEYRVTLLLWAVEGLSYKQIAYACDCAMGTVMSRLYRARQVLGRQLRQFAVDRRLGGRRIGS